MRYEFGVMSSKYELEADDEDTAYVSMSLFIGKNIPIAVYSRNIVFLPKDCINRMLKHNTTETEKVKACLETIKCISE